MDEQLQATPKPVTPIAPLELQEYLFAQTAAEHAKNSSLGGGAQHIRETLRLHRFSLFLWLMQNGVKIPIELLADQNHPEVGQQYPDMPVK